MRNGTYFWNNGDRYEGELCDGKLNGSGTKFYASGEKYVGGKFSS